MFHDRMIQIKLPRIGWNIFPYHHFITLAQGAETQYRGQHVNKIGFQVNARISDINNLFGKVWNATNIRTTSTR